MEYSAVTHRGRVREINEDSYFAGDGVFIVADGMGGHNAGEVASRLAIEVFLRGLGDNLDRQGLKEGVVKSMQEANAAVYARSREEPGMAGMGTTMTVAVLRSGAVYIGHVGDSRAYIYREGRLTRLTEDHSLVAELTKLGKISQEQAFTHPRRNVITRAMGIAEHVEVDISAYKVEEGDILLLCTDGLTEHLRDEEIAAILSRGGGLERISGELVEEANRRGGSDNISVILVECSGMTEGLSGPAAGTAPEDISIKLESEPEREAAPGPSGNRKRLGYLVLTVALVFMVIVLGGFFLILYMKGHYYYVGEDPQAGIALYRGIPYKIFGVELYSVKERSGMPLERLPEEEQYDLRHPSAGSYEDSRDKYQRLVEFAESHVRVPDLKGMTLEEAEETLRQNQLRLSVVPQGAASRGVVQSQSPEAGTLQGIDTVVTVWARSPD